MSFSNQFLERVCQLGCQKKYKLFKLVKLNLPKVFEIEIKLNEAYTKFIPIFVIDYYHLNGIKTKPNQISKTNPVWNHSYSFQFDSGPSRIVHISSDHSSTSDSRSMELKFLQDIAISNNVT